MLVPSVLLLQLVYVALLLFVPIMGRTGTAAYPDLFIGCMTALAVVVLLVSQVNVWLCCVVFFTPHQIHEMMIPGVDNSQSVCSQPSIPAQ